MAERNDEAPPAPVQAWTDGCSRGNPGPGGWGAVLRCGPHRREMLGPLGETTNNIAELTAIRETLAAITDRTREVIIYTDSKYAIGLLTQGFKAKKNTELVAEIRALAARFPRLRLVKVKGHAGVAENERADRLANRAAELAGAAPR